MSIRRWASALLVLTACAPARGPIATSPTPTSAPPASAPATPATPVAAAGPAPDWHLRDLATDGIPGTGAARALRELLKGAAPTRQIVVAVIDGGVDTAHVALRGALWTNPGERPGNRADDENDGYVDDVRGWNFLGGADGRSVDKERLELTRIVAGCRAGQPSPVAVACPVLTATRSTPRARRPRRCGRSTRASGACWMRRSRRSRRPSASRPTA